MNRTQVSWVLRVHAAFNFIAGVILYFFPRPLISAALWPDTDKPLYANVLGAAIIGLAINAWFASNDPDRLREVMLSGVVTIALVAVAILYWLLIAGIDKPPLWLGLAAVAVQGILTAAEGVYLYTSRRTS